MLTQDRLKELLHYNPETGVFTWRVRGKGRRMGVPAGNTDADGYIQICVERCVYRGHRLAWLYMRGELPRGMLDHIDHNPSNNSIANLREVDRSGNQQNQIRAMANNKATGLLGVAYHPKRNTYTARIQSDGKRKFLGTYKTAADAFTAYVAAKREVHSTCTL